MALIDFLSGTGKLNGDNTGSMWTRLLDTIGNGIGKKHRAPILSTSEALSVAVKNDDISVFLRGDRKGNVLIGNYIPEIQENFEGATVNVQKWSPASTTFAPTQATLSGYSINPTALTTVSAVSILQSQRLLSKLPRVPLQLKTRLRHLMVSGAIADFGFGVPATTTLIVPNGVAFRLTNSGQVQGVMTINSVQIAIANVVSQVASNGNTIGGDLNMSNSYYTSNYFVYDIIIDDDNAVFTIQDTSTGEMIGLLKLPVPVSQIKMWGATALPVYYRMFNNTAPASAPVFILTEMQALSLDWAINPDIQQLAGSLNLSDDRQPFTGASNENNTNSTAPVSATLANATAGYTTLGGKYQFVAVAGAETDYCLFGFQVPAGSRFICEGIRIEALNTVVAVATSATVLEWSMGFNQSAVSLATANVPRKSIGIQTFPIGSAVGAVASPIDVDFKTPKVTESGRFITVILKMPIATATATEVFRGIVSIKGRFI